MIATEQQFISEAPSTPELAMSDQTTTLATEPIITTTEETLQVENTAEMAEASEQIDTVVKEESEYQACTVIENSQGKEETMILRDKGALLKMMDGARICAGQKTSEQMQSEYDQNDTGDKKDDIQANKFQLPSDLFKEFPEVNNDNGDDFEYYVSHIIIQFLEKFPVEANKALEFPPCIDGDGRARIHSICNFLGLASHSQGQAKTRKVLVYRREHFLKDQAKEEERKDKEK